MTSTDWLPLIQLLRGAGLEFETGLTDPEVDQIEKRFNFRFPPDLRAFLQTNVPFWNSPRWHTATAADIQSWLDEPMRGLLFDVASNELWLPEWGERPSDPPEALTLARAKINEAPRLIPLIFNRYIPERPHETGNPVFAVHQADIVYYGFDLEDYLRHEFRLPRAEWPVQAKLIEFWDPDRFQRLRWGDDYSAFAP